MAAANLEKRIDALEREVRSLKTAIKKSRENHSPWWERLAGTFKDDSLFEEITNAGEEYRKSLTRLKLD